MRIRRAETRQEFERVIDDFITQGYEVESRGEENARLKKKDYGSLLGHIVVFVLTFWTFGLGNLIYALYKNKKADEVVVRIEPVDSGGTPEAA